MEKINFGFVGCGWIVQKTYLPILKQMNEATLYSVYDIDEEKAQKCAVEFGIKQVFHSVDDLLEAPVDAVIIATPNCTHEAYARKAIMKNKHVICEKPTVLHTSDYEQLQEAAGKQKCLFLPAYVNRFRSEITELHKILNGGVLGNIHTVEAGWIRKCGYPSLGGWFTNKQYAGGGVLMDLGPHILDIALTLFQNRVEPVKATLETWYKNYDLSQVKNYSAQWYDGDKGLHYDIDVETSAFGKVIFTGGKILNVRLSWNAPVEHDETYFVVTGEKGKLIVKTLFGFSTNRADELNRIEVLQNEGNSTTIVFDDAANEQMKSFNRLCKYIIGCILKEESPQEITDNGRNVVKLTELLYQNEKAKRGDMEVF